MSSTDLGRALCIITGASRGLGRALAKETSRWMKPGSVLILAARSADNLRTLQQELAESEEGKAGLVVKYVVADMSQMEGVENLVRTSKDAFSEDIDHVILVNNAGTLGDVSRYMTGFTEMAEVDSFMSLNVSSCLCLTARILQAFPQRPGMKRTVINISSLCAVKPFPSWVLYCTAKAARDMTFRVLAEEQPDLRVISYGPGPLDTDMLKEGTVKSADPDLRKNFSAMFDEGKVLTCETSSAKLIKILLEDIYTSGAHIDFYDS